MSTNTFIIQYTLRICSQDSETKMNKVYIGQRKR